jgi:hypothetical protein
LTVILLVGNVSVQKNALNKSSTTEITMKHGRMIVCNDEWPFLDNGFHLGDSKVFVKDILEFFSNGKQEGKRNVLICTGIYGSKFIGAIHENGYKATLSWVAINPNDIDAEFLLRNYDALFIGADRAIDNEILADYLKNGGCIYLAGIGVTGDSAQWNGFLKRFGLEFEYHGNGLDGASVNIKTPPFQNVRYLRMCGGTWIRKNSDFPGTNILADGMFATTVIAVPERFDLTVKATDTWLDTGVDLEIGCQLRITAAGKWKNDGGPETYEVTADGFDTYKNPAAILPDANFASLIGRVGAGHPFFVGSSFSQNSAATGRLFLQMNDSAGDFQDNLGEIKVTVEIQ